MLLARGRRIAAATACMGLAACATSPLGGRSQMLEVPLASVHSNIGFSILGGSKPGTACADATPCQAQPRPDAAKRFGLQVERVAALLQDGVRELHPELASRVPALVDMAFDVYVVAGDAPGSTSSANGRIALSAALGAAQPYDEWVAFVIAREMGHVIARHHEENSAASIATSLILTVLLPGSSLLKSAISAGGSGIAASSKREIQATEADVIAWRLLDAAGYRQREVALALRVGSPGLDDGAWSEAFRTSSATLQAAARAAGIAAAATPWLPPPAPETASIRYADLKPEVEH